MVIEMKSNQVSESIDILRNFEGYIEFGYVISAQGKAESNTLHGLRKSVYPVLKCSIRDQEENYVNNKYDNIEKFLNQVLSGEGTDRKITIYLTPRRIRKIGKEYDDKEFVIADFKNKIEKYVNILKMINPYKFKNLDINNLNLNNISIDYSGCC